MKTLIFSLILLVFSSASLADLSRISVSMKNEEETAVLCCSPEPAPFESEADYAITDASGAVVAEVYPFEIFADCFWSQPLGSKVLGDVGAGMAVSAAALPKDRHYEIRYRGEEYLNAKRKRHFFEIKAMLSRIQERLVAQGREFSNVSETLLEKISFAEVLKKIEAERARMNDYASQRNELSGKLAELNKDPNKNARKIERANAELSSLDEKIRDRQREIGSLESSAGISPSRMVDILKETSKRATDASIEAESISGEIESALARLEAYEAGFSRAK